MKLTFESIKLNEYLNDSLLDDSEFVNFILGYVDKGFSPEEIEDTVAYIVETMDYKL